MDFVQAQFGDGLAVPHLVVNGYFPSLSVKHVLLTISRDYLGYATVFRDLNEHARFIAEMFRRMFLGEGRAH